MTASFLRRVSSSVLQPRVPAEATSWSLALPAWGPGGCRWWRGGAHPGAAGAPEPATDPAGEEDELAGIYVERGVEPSMARIVAQQLMARDALKAHGRDELGMLDQLNARPLQAALASAGTFAVGAALPILTVLLAPAATVSWVVAGVSLACLAALGALAAQAGGAPVLVGAGRVAFWGALAMGVTAGVGRLFGTVV